MKSYTKEKLLVLGMVFLGATTLFSFSSTHEEKILEQNIIGVKNTMIEIQLQELAYKERYKDYTTEGISFPRAYCEKDIGFCKYLFNVEAKTTLQVESHKKCDWSKDYEVITYTDIDNGKNLLMATYDGCTEKLSFKKMKGINTALIGGGDNYKLFGLKEKILGKNVSD